jgi:hypothetical protein
MRKIYTVVWDRASPAARFCSAAIVVVGLMTAWGRLASMRAEAADSLTNFPPANVLPVQVTMPDPLVTSEGKKITTPAEWPARREQMKRVIEYYALGHVPPPPGNVAGETLESRTLASGKISYRRVHLSFGPEEKLGFDISMFLPLETNGIKAPFPTIVQPSFSRIEDNLSSGVAGIATGTNSVASKPPHGDHALSAEAAAGQYGEALERGYAVVTFFYQDCGKDDRSYRQSGFFPAYPDFDWADLAAWAWGMSRCVDYLVQQDFVDQTKFICVGHSRLGKAALVAGAFDDRFALVAAAGSGCGGAGAYRFNGLGRGGKEGLEDMVKNFPQWTNPRLAEFSGQVEKLPFDQHWLIDLVAPRLFIAPDGLSDGATSVNALIQSYQAAMPVYGLLGVPTHLGINFRPGGHMLAPEDWKAILDFADQQLRGRDVKRVFNQLPGKD